jgi:hypothetical protein
MLSQEEIKKVQESIKNSILRQVKNGEQSKDLNKALSCGQFINVPTLKQRGMHGVSSAIRVLASFDGNFNDEIAGLLNYIENRKEIEKDNGLEKKIAKDETNVIKIGELLYSLSFVKQGYLDTSRLIKSLGDSLLSNIKNSESWGYFLDSKDDSELLPTAFAYLGLRSNNFKSLSQIEAYLKLTIEDSFKNKKLENPSYFASVIAAIYILSLFNVELNQKQLIEKLWKIPFCVMDINLEQNIEYPFEYEHFYVRVPWQLYFLALTSRYSPRYFTKKACRVRVKDLGSLIEGKGFRYIQSGNLLSTRTNAILFDILSFIDRYQKKNIRYHVFSAINDVIWFFNRKWVKTILTIIIFCGIFFSIYKWVNNSNSKFEDLAPEFIGYFVSLLLIFTKR